MIDERAFTRRRFLQSGLVMASTVGTLPHFVQAAASAIAGEPGIPGNRPGVPEDRVLVIVQLSGGNDGLNTVVPFGVDEYYKLRRRIAVPKTGVITLDKAAGIGLHPSMKPVAALADDGLATIVQGAGYPNPNRSHFASMDIWHAGDTLDSRGHGWVGKAMDVVTGGKPGEENATACVAIGREAPLATQGKHIKPVTFERADLFRWGAQGLDDALDSAYHATQRQKTEAKDDEEWANQAAFLRRTALDAQIASDRIRRAVARGTETKFPGGGLANQLRLVAAMIRAELPTRVYYVGMGGFDTHAGQTWRHANLLTQFATAMQAFQNELKATGHDGRVMTMAFSEFGRRVAENASQGTDHGAAGPMFLFGPMVRPGLLGEHPSLTKLDKGDLIHTVDFRSVYAGVLEQWMKADSKKVLGKVYRPAVVVGEKSVAR